MRLASATVNDSLELDVDDGDTKDFLNAMDKVAAYLKRKKRPDAAPESVTK